MKKIILASLIAASCTAAIADNVIITQTKTWKSVPITVDSDKHVFTVVEGTAVPDSDYYYTYSGYRCLKEKVDVAGVNMVTFKSSTGDSEIYCYPEQ